MGDFRLGGHDFTLVSVNNSIANSWREEDASPTTTQSAENAPDAANLPGAVTEYSNWQGSLGLYERSLQRDDFSRFFLADWDQTRPMQTSAWVRWPGDTAAITGLPAGASIYTPSLLAATAYPAFVLTDDPAGPGFISALTTGAAGYVRWNGTTGAFEHQNACPLPVPPVARGFASRFSSVLIPPPATTTATADGKLLYGADIGGGLGAIYSAAGAAQGMLGWLAVPFYDHIMVFSLATGNLTIAAWNMDGTPSTVKVQLVNTVPTQLPTGATVSDSLGKINGERALAGVVAAEGVLWVATDRKVYAVEWNDDFNTFQVEELFSLPRITGAPVAFNSEVYIPSGQRLAHIIPGQRGYTWAKPDQFDTMPAPFNGRIVQCLPTPDALYCKLVEESTTSCRAAVMRLDASGAWSCVTADTTTSLLGRMPMVATVDREHPPAIGYFTDGTHVRLLPAQDSGRNPRTLLVAQRPQAAVGRGLSPWETGVAETNQKQLQRYRIEVEDCVGVAVRVYYQFKTDSYSGAANTFATGIGAGLGTFHLCGVITAGTRGRSGAIDAFGNAWVWVEFDGETAYPGVGILPLYPDYTAVRWLIEITGDPTGVHAPLLRNFRFDREEYISKAKVITAYVDLTAGMARRGGTDGLPGPTDTVRDAAWVQREMAFIESMVESKHAQTLLTPKGATYQVAVSKWVEALEEITDEGIVSAKVQLSMKVEPLQGVL